MGHGKETPRQKMIGMMYLFLTAMLALNVSRSVLNAFTLVNHSLKQTTENFAEKNESIYTEFQVAYAENPEKVGPWKEKADEVKKQADSLYNLVQHYKELIVRTADGENYNMDNIQSKDNQDVPPQKMLVEKGGERGEHLKSAIDSFRNYLLSLVDTSAAGIQSAIKSNLDTSDPDPAAGGREGENVTWLTQNFENIPLVGVVTLMSKMQSDIRNSEADVITYLYRQIDAGSFKFNKLEAIVNAKSDYVLRGNTYKAEVFIAASDTTVQPKVLVNGNPLEIKDGKGIYESKATSTGLKEWDGVIQYKGPQGNIREFPFEAEYQVGSPSLVVSPTKMNVFYMGVDNPVDISVSGVPQSKVRPTVRPHGKLVRRSGNYYVRVNRAQNVEISASVEMDDGSMRSMGSKEFRVKRVPDPVAKVAGETGGSIEKAFLLAQTGVEAVLENFDFDLDFNVTQFSVSANIGGYQQMERSNDMLFTEAQKNLIRKVQGGRVYIEDIKAEGPDGTERNLPPIIFKLN